MARGINKVILVGNLGRDPEVRYAASGAAITNVTIATSESWKDKSTGENVDKTEWHRVVFFNRLAEIAGEYLRKGSQIYVEGKLQTRKWQDKDGQDRYTTEVVANELQMLGGRSSGGSGGSDDYNQDSGASYGSNAGEYNQPRSNNKSKQNQKPQQSSPAFEDFDDDIPF